MAINLHLLRIFATVAECGSFSKAADELYISQPAVSKGVLELEHQLGTNLIDRSGRKATLTEAGSLLQQHARQIFALERSAETALEQLHGLQRGHLALGASQTTGTYLLPPIMGVFHRQYPGVQLSLDIGNTQQVVERLLKGVLDTAFVEGPVDEPGIVIQPWRVDKLVVIAAPDHPLVNQQPVSLARLLVEPFVTREPGSGTRAVMEQALRERNAQIQIAMELGSNQAVKQAVSAGLGISVVSEATVIVALKAEMLAVLDVPEFVLTRTLTQISISGRPSSPALMAFQEILIETSTE
jgi:DNA-binding transcriptional LysR family regulator